MHAGKEIIMNKLSKKIICFSMTIAMLSGLLISTPSMVKAADDTLLLVEKTPDSAEAGVEKTYPFTVTEKGHIYFDLYVPSPIGFSVIIKDSSGTQIGDEMQITPTDLYWTDQSTDELNIHWNYIGIVLSPGDYTATLILQTASEYDYAIQWEATQSSISSTSLTLTNGFSQKLKITNAKDSTVTWNSSNKKIATVDKNGKVTAKADKGTCLITATVGNQELICKVKVKKNSYSDHKVTPSDYKKGQAGTNVYSAVYDSKGNLVLKLCFANNSKKTCVSLQDIKIVARTDTKKEIAVYTLKYMKLQVPAGATKTFTVTIPKKDVKIAKANLRFATISVTGGKWLSNK